MFWPRVTLGPQLTTALAVASLFSAASTGLDYIALPDPSIALTYVERAAPLDLWGLLMVSAVICAVCGWLVQLWQAVFLAHMALAGFYCAFGVSALASVISPWEGYGWRTGLGWICLQGVGNFVLAAAATRELDRERRARVWARRDGL